MARVYHDELGVPSIGLRPYVVYGPGRDQGMTSGPTVAMLAAVRGEPCHIGYSGTAQYDYAPDVARALVVAAHSGTEGAAVYNVPGAIAPMAEVVARIQAVVPGAEITFDGAPLPFPPVLEAVGFDRDIGPFPRTPLADGDRRRRSPTSGRSPELGEGASRIRRGRARGRASGRPLDRDRPAAPGAGAGRARRGRAGAAPAPRGQAAARALVRRGQTVAISICDGTRAQPRHVVMPAILDELDGIVDLDDVVILVATGTHRGNTPEELRAMLGDEVVDSVRIVNHDARDDASLAWVGRLGADVPVWLNREWLEADVRITTGFVEPHFFAGFSGGPKMVAPGLAGARDGADAARRGAHRPPRRTLGRARRQPGARRRAGDRGRDRHATSRST